MKVDFTVQQLATANNAEKDTAYNLALALEGLGVIKKTGTIPAVTGKGRGQNVYSGEREKISAALANIKFPEPAAK